MGALEIILILAGVAFLLCGYFLPEMPEGASVGLFGSVGEYSGHYLPAVFRRVGGSQRGVLFSDPPVYSERAAMAFAESGVFLFYRHVLWRFPD